MAARWRMAMKVDGREPESEAGEPLDHRDRDCCRKSVVVRTFPGPEEVEKKDREVATAAIEEMGGCSRQQNEERAARRWVPVL
jgi:hypothetical protein